MNDPSVEHYGEAVVGNGSALASATAIAGGANRKHKKRGDQTHAHVVSDLPSSPRLVVDDEQH